ncbi:hypothetical protein [Caudoviricetes sp.]|nr:hypothetical protein [Caudoviricetes sp.]
MYFSISTTVISTPVKQFLYGTAIFYDTSLLFPIRNQDAMKIYFYAEPKLVYITSTPTI